jgi:hypothetical protein
MLSTRFVRYNQGKSHLAAKTHRRLGGNPTLLVYVTPVRSR